MQAVNLYLPEFQPTKEWLTAKSLCFSLLGMMLIFTAAAYVQHQQLSEFEQQIMVLEEQQVSSSDRIELYRKQAGLQDTKAIDDTILSLRKDIRQRQAVREFFLSKSLGNELGYSSRLRALSLSSPKTIALERFRFSRGDEFVELQGETSSPHNVAVFLDELSADSRYENAVFGALSIVEDKHIHRFNIGFEALFQSSLSGEGL
ncbi:MAG: hypothetical protein ACI93R_000628 [Flavobacteriales bacterium]|jgi:hypothetical protein